MPVNFLTHEQRENYGRYAKTPTPEEITHFFLLGEDDHGLISGKRGRHNRIGFALQLTTVRFLGTFLEDPLDVPAAALISVAQQLGISDIENIDAYNTNENRWEHASEIKAHCSYHDFTEHTVGLRFSRWLYGLCWTGTERPSVLFERATDWLLTHKVLLPGRSTLERFVARLQKRVEKRLGFVLLRTSIKRQ